MSKQFNTRLPELTHEQIDALSQAHGLTKTQVVILAVDRFVRALESAHESESEEADKDIRRLKTVARIAPHLDLGQDNG
jgi:predicted DNA-binding protein